MLQIQSLGESSLVLTPSELAISFAPLQVNIATSIKAERLADLQAQLTALAQTCQALDEFADVVLGMGNLTLLLKDSDKMAYWHGEIATLWHKASRITARSQQITIPVCYGGEAGPDLEYVAHVHQLSTAEVIRLHTTPSYRVCFLGFQPGFAYLDGLASQLFTPRRDEPRLSVPKGSVGIGNQQTGVYPAAAPGGWQLIGQTKLTLFDVNSERPNLLMPGDTVIFCPTQWDK